ncbi:hypothetical protein ALP75_201052 [Pseudomonas syringae pv. actinidiae]|nr:hypothetical protein ALP75_201052 [Pseudomonas syringae pv. actinidiae]
MAGLMKRQPMVVSSSFMLRENAASALPMTNGARDIDSTPPAIASSISPEAMARNAVPMASMPDAHRRLRVTPGTLVGRPASKAAMRATLRLSSPAWLAQPKNTSSISSQFTEGLRSISALIGTAARSSARTDDNPPPKRPIGVRIASQIKTSRIMLLLQPGHVRQPCALPDHAAQSAPRQWALRRPQHFRQNGFPNRWPRSPARGSRRGAG